MSAALPEYVRELASIVVARLAPDGTVLEANRGYTLLAGGHGAAAHAVPGSHLFIQPSFRDLVERCAPPGESLVYRGMLNLGEPGTTPLSLSGFVYRSDRELLVVAEPDAADSERLHRTVLSLNNELAETQRQLVRDIQARKRAERERAQALEQEREARRAAEEARRQLEQANRTLEETNHGIMTLYAELDDKAQALQRASEMKSRFLSNMTHEFRTPLNAILSLSRMLLDGTDGELSPEQQTQAGFIRQSAETLSTLVNDLLDLARIEAGKTAVRLSEFEVEDLFGALRGTLRPLVPKGSPVTLVFETPAGLPSLCSDEGKVAQVLRNFVANALKFTERGEVRVSAALDGAQAVVFTVADTGIGVAPEDQGRIFEEFTQVEGPVQRRARGTGLGLPLSRKLAELLGGKVWMHSTPGVGSTFCVRIPLVYSGHADEVYPSQALAQRDLEGESRQRLEKA